MTFELEVTDGSRLIDAEGRLMPSAVAKPVSELKLQIDEGKQKSEENMLMRAIAANRNSSIANLAVTCGFVGATGQPQKNLKCIACPAGWSRRSCWSAVASTGSHQRASGRLGGRTIQKMSGALMMPSAC